MAQCITIQVRTSKPDVFIKLQVLESEETMVSTLGKGQAIIPGFYFLGSERALSSQCKYLPGARAACMNNACVAVASKRLNFQWKSKLDTVLDPS